MTKMKHFFEAYKYRGLYGIKRLIIKTYFERKVVPIRGFKRYKYYFENKIGIEIGGLSSVFRNEIPIYSIVKELDGCNFSDNTIWEGKLKEGLYYQYSDEKKGYQYISEASDLKQIPSDKYDFLISSHCLEHCANTLKTMKEWLRVVKKGGAILLVLPDKKNTFDHNREVTTFEHFLEDYRNEIKENDLTHLTEILDLHDLDRDIGAGTKEQFRERSMENFSNRCLHHHVFDFELLKQIFDYYNIQIKEIAYAPPYHQIVLGLKK